MGRFKIKENEEWKSLAWKQEVDKVETDVKDSQDKISILNGKVKPETPLNTTSQNLTGAVNEIKGDLDEYKGKYAKQQIVLENLVGNGLFKDGTEGFFTSGEFDISVEDEVLICNSLDGSGGNGNYNYTQEQTDSKIYLNVRAKSLEQMDQPFRISSNGGGKIITFKVSDFFDTKSNISDIDLSKGITLGYYSSSYRILTLIEHIISINLTKTFGKANEPTKEEMDLLLEQIGAFDGKITLTQKEIFNWQTAINRKQYERIEQLENAITELGGTI